VNKILSKIKTGLRKNGDAQLSSLLTPLINMIKGKNVQEQPKHGGFLPIIPLLMQIVRTLKTLKKSGGSLPFSSLASMFSNIRNSILKHNKVKAS